MQLTTSWQRISADNFYSSHYTEALEGRYTSQSTAGNYTDAEFRIVNYADSGYTWRTTNGSVKFTGAYTDSGSSATYPNNVVNGQVMLSISKRIYHDENGSKTITLGAHLDGVMNGVRYNSDPPQTSVTMPKIDRYPMINTSDNFSDEDDPVITYTTALGFSGASVQACIASSDGNTIYVPYREVDVPSGRYVFELTAQERTTLRQATPNSNELNIQFKLRTTTTGGDTYFSTSNKKMTIINNTPTFTPSLEETNESIIDILGSTATKLVMNASEIEATITPTALKEATIASVVVSYDGASVTMTTSPYTTIIPITDVSAFSVIVTDSRGNSSTGIVAWDSENIISYLPIDITALSFERETQTSSNIILNATITYKQVDFTSSVSNAPTLKWKLDDGTYNTISSSDYTIDTTNDTITINNLELTNALVYTSAGEFKLYVEDLLSNDTDSKVVTKGVATFDYGEHDLQVNGELYIADTNRENAQEIRDLIYPVGSIYISVVDDTAQKVHDRFGGTWVAFATGRTLVGIDTNDIDFNTSMKTGGSKDLQEHTHTMQSSGSHSHNAHFREQYFGSTTTGNAYDFARDANASYQYDKLLINNTGAHTHTINNAGTGNSGNLQPYIAVYMWRRTA